MAIMRLRPAGFAGLDDWAAAPAEISRVDMSAPAVTGERSWSGIGKDLADDFIRSIFGIRRPAPEQGYDNMAALVEAENTKRTMMVVGGLAIAGLLAFIALRD